jgi:CRISPR-associated endonuclease/helicase Cas3
MDLSIQAKSLWAKKSSKGEGELWLPLYMHMYDAFGVARSLWEYWLPEKTKQIIAEGISVNCDFTQAMPIDELSKNLYVFLAGIHDLGKATPVFQSKSNSFTHDWDNLVRMEQEDCGLYVKNFYSEPRAIPHALASHILLKKQGLDESLAVVLGGHHGKPPELPKLNKSKAYPDNIGMNDKTWLGVQDELFNYILDLVGFENLKGVKINKAAQVLLTGLVIMADWVASDEGYFQYVPLHNYPKLSKDRVNDAWKELKFPELWIPEETPESTDLYKLRFNGMEPRFVQKACQDLTKKIIQPGICILEAPMGVGKTEAAFVMAEILAVKTGSKGLFFALPTQATANGIFPRFHKWINRLSGPNETYSIKLAHGKAHFNEEYMGISTKIIRVGDDEDQTGVNDNDNVIVHEWFSGRKKGILSDFIVGTIDQVLMGGLKQKHVMLRHLGLANKVIIIDECHAYDAYMSSYLYKILNWLGIYKIPVIVLSATLPSEKRKDLINAYLNKKIEEVQEDPVFKTVSQKEVIPAWASSREYPLLTYTDGKEVFQERVGEKKESLVVSIEYLENDNNILTLLEDELSEDGCVGIIMNTVSRAQNMAKTLTDKFGKDCVRLIHSRFMSPDRAKKEAELLCELGPPVKGQKSNRPKIRIVVGTQVMEQSLDVDFDLLITDICPMDLLIQRIGRLHRHDRRRPSRLAIARCIIIGANGYEFDKGSEKIYGRYYLMHTRALLPVSIHMPQDIPELVQNAYERNCDKIPIEMREQYEDAKRKHDEFITKKETRASTFQISKPESGGNTLVNWLNTNISDKKGESSVRDAGNTIEVLLIQRKNNGRFYMLSIEGQYGEKEIPIDVTPDEDFAATMSMCSLQLPSILCTLWNIDRTIEELEKQTIAYHLDMWQRSSWLKGELFLILDNNMETKLCGYELIYDQNLGLILKKSEDKND